MKKFIITFLSKLNKYFNFKIIEILLFRLKYGLDYKKIKSLLYFDSSYYKQREEDLIKSNKKINLMKRDIPPFFVNPDIINDHNKFFKDNGKFTLNQLMMVENFNNKKELNKQWKKNT